jgi:multiple sugar transport system ATP-binding protein
MAEVILKNVNKFFDKANHVVKDVSLQIMDKEFIVLVGPSGCGKSTTLRMIAGLEDISDGELYIDGILVNDVPPKDRDISMVFQNYALYPHMTVYENMAFGLKLRKYAKDEIKTRVDNAAEILGLNEYLTRKPKELSGGQRQRVALGRAIVRNPKVFLFDEPLSNLDAKLRVQMRAEISKLHQKLEATIIYVTHDQVEAMTMGDKIVVMNNGVIQQIDTPLNLYYHPKNYFVASFIGSPSMNFINGKISNDIKFISDGNDLSFSLPSEIKDIVKPKHEIILGIRPENLNKNELDENVFSFGSKVELVEPMGNELFIYTKVDNKTWIIRTNSLDIPKIQSNIEITFHPNKIHLFDKKSGDVIA